MPRLQCLIVVLVCAWIAAPRAASAQPAAEPQASPPVDAPSAAASDAALPDAAVSNAVLPQAAPPAAQAQLSDQAPLGAAAAPAQQLESARVVARVGDEAILAVDMLPPQILTEVLTKFESLPPEVQETLIKRLNDVIDMKLIAADAMRGLPAENIPKIKANIEKEYIDNEVQKQMKAAKIDTLADFDNLLRKAGTTLDRQKQIFFERTVAQSWIAQKVKVNQEVTHEQLRTYYHAHLTEFEEQAKAKWEQISVRFDRPAGRADAYRLLAELGTQVQQGATVDQVVQKASQNSDAVSGGANDWVQRGNLAKQKVEAALFGLPVGQLSQIIEEDKAFYIVRVLERHDQRQIPFVEAQRDIKKHIMEERAKNQRDEYLKKLRDQTPVWTYFDSMKRNSRTADSLGPAFR